MEGGRGKTYKALEQKENPRTTLPGVGYKGKNITKLRGKTVEKGGGRRKCFSEGTGHMCQGGENEGLGQEKGNHKAPSGMWP